MKFKTSYIDQAGKNTEIELDLAVYQEAERAQLSLPQYLAMKFPTQSDKYGTAFEQFLAASGVFMSYDAETGLRPPTMQQLLNGEATPQLGAILRPDGTNALTIAGRMFFPAVILQMIESELRTDHASYMGAFAKMVAQTVTVSSPRYDQPIINVTRPQGARGMPIGQLAEPNRMLSITVAEVSKRMPTYAIGLEISQEALAATTLDLVGIAVREQTLAERADNVDKDLKAMILGDVDSGQAALTAAYNADTLDSTISANGVLTQKAWVKFLRKAWKKRNVNWVITDIDTYLAIEGRTGRPTATDKSAFDERLNALPSAANPGMGEPVQVFIVEDSATLGGANQIVGLDSRYAIRKVVYVGATYRAIEEFVLRKSTALRYDWSERHERLGYSDAWDRMQLVNT